MKKKETTEKQFANIEEGLSKTEQFIEDNSKLISAIITGIIIIFLAYYGVNNLYLNPLNNKAQKQLFIAEQYFEKDSFQLALNGNDNFEGLLDIIDKYSKTKSGKLAKYYAGICYLNIGEYTNAIKILDKYKTDDLLLLSISKAAIGDAFSEINQPKEAIEYYKESIEIDKNILTTPITLIKCAKLYEMQEDYNNAVKCYQTIQNDYSESVSAKNIEKYIKKIDKKTSK